MQVKHYVAIGWKRACIYGGFTLLAWAAGLFAIAHPEAEGHMRVVGALLIVTTMAIVARLISARIAYGHEIEWYTPQGMAVLPGTARNWMIEHKKLVEESIERTIIWYGQHFPAGEHSEEAIRDFLNGGEIKVLVQDGPIEDKRYGIKARELTEGNSTRVLWQPHDSGADFLALLRHGIGHMCLTAMKVPVEAHHARMAADGFPDA